MKNINLLTLILTIVLLGACSDSILDKSNPNQLTKESFFSTDAQAFAAVTAVYAGLQGLDMYSREYFFTHDCLSDDNQSGGGQLEGHRARVLNHSFDGSNDLIISVFRGCYRIVHRANIVIQRVPEMDVPVQISAADQKRFIAEAKFMRALAYFELVSLWGRVPLMLEPATTTDGTPRSQSEDEIYNLIFSDLATAIDDLPRRKALSAGELGRASVEAAEMLTAKVHLFRGQYAEAKPLLDDIIANGEFSLVDRFLDNFEEENENNEESIFEVQMSTDFGSNGAWTAQGSGAAEVTMRGQEYGPTAWRNLIPSDELVAEFEDGDPRFGYTFYDLGDPITNNTNVLRGGDNANVQGDTTKVSWRKYTNIYKWEAENSYSGINFRMMRYADVLLMAAEVENEVGTSTNAIAYLNQVRNRADVMMPNYPTTEYPCSNKDEIFEAVVHERRVELASEQIRNRDIRRWRRLGKLTTEPIASWKDKYDLLPIPVPEIDNNNALSPADQNPGH